MSNQGLIFIPDISGFSEFVNQTEIEHSRLIIQELLETLINANEIGLEVSEIEGDAILFYRFGEPPDLDEVYKQVERMFVSFHRSLLVYDIRKYCQCDACIASASLTLKVITHYGEFTGYSVKSFNKLIGKDIIVAHELLKNDIDQHEYWLVTNSLSPAGRPAASDDGLQWDTGAKQTRGGEVEFHYAQLGRLKERVPSEPLVSGELKPGALMLRATREYDAGVITLFHATGDFSNRGRWSDGVGSVEEVNHLLPRVGMRCRCVMKDGSVRSYTSTYYDWDPAHIEFRETEEGSGDVTRYVLESLTPERSRLTIEHYVTGGPAAVLFFRLFRRREAMASLERSLANLVSIVEELRVTEQAALAEAAVCYPDIDGPSR